MEMNIHIPQSIQTRMELQEIASVIKQIISPAHGNPIIAIENDTLAGAYLFTGENVYVSRRQLYNLMMTIKEPRNQLPPPAKIENGTEYWEGRQIYAFILPEMSMDMGGVTIVNGKITKGQMNSKLLGAKAGGLVRQIVSMFSLERAAQFLNDNQRLITRWFTNRGFTMSYGDIMIPRDLQREIHEIIDGALQEVGEIIRKAHYGVYNRELPDELLLDELENDITQILSDKSEEPIKKRVVAYLKSQPYNSLYQASEYASGTKGTANHVQRIMGSVGQNIDSTTNKRIGFAFTLRALPHFPKNHYEPGGRGFSRNSFSSGVGPVDAFFLSATGRIGVINTAIMTATTGYLQRRLTKSMEDIITAYDGTIRNAKGSIIQFMYGGDGFDQTKLEQQPVSLIAETNQQLRESCEYDESFPFDRYIRQDATASMPAMTEDERRREYTRLVQIRDDMRQKYFRRMQAISDIRSLLPFNIRNLIYTTTKKFGLDDNVLSNMTPIFIMNRVDQLISAMDHYSKESGSFFMVKASVYYWLTSKRVITQYHMTSQVFEYVIETIFNKFIGAFATPGELIGPIAAQSIGEPSTQSTLSSFHAAGTKLATTASVPRLEELIKCTRNMKTPSMTIYLREEFEQDEKFANMLKNHLEYTRLSDIVETCEIMFESPDMPGTLDEDLEFMRFYQHIAQLFQIEANPATTATPWVIRITFNREVLMTRDITMSDIQEIIHISSYEQLTDIEAIYADDNAGSLVMRIKVYQSQSSDDLPVMREIQNRIMNMKIKGVDGLKLVIVDKENRISYFEDGTYEENKIYVLRTNGINMYDIMSHDMVDPQRTTVNDIMIIYDIYGIAACRQKIIYEMNELFKKSETNYRHLSLLVDVMTSRGALMAIMRHSINKSSEIELGTKLSFESVTDVLLKASLFAQADQMRGVSANIMAGAFVKAGTNYFDLILDEDKLVNQLEMKRNVGETVDIKDAEQLLELVDATLREVEPEDAVIHDVDFEFPVAIELLQSHRIPNFKF